MFCQDMNLDLQVERSAIPIEPQANTFGSCKKKVQNAKRNGGCSVPL